MRPEYLFECASRPADWAEKIGKRPVPENVTAQFDIPANAYYELIKGAYCMVLPLCENRAAGLINIIKAICWGVIPLISRNTAMEQYLPESLRDSLQFEIGDAGDLVEKLDAIYAMTEEEYDECIRLLQDWMEANFTSDRAIGCIDEVIQKIIASQEASERSARKG